MLYSQMQGIYRGNRVPFVGSFVLFMQSPAGWLCIILVLFAIIVTPMLERKLETEAKARLALIEANTSSTKDVQPQQVAALTRGGPDD